MPVAVKVKPNYESDNIISESLPPLETLPLLHGKTALVTGSTSGIGLGIALSLGRQGANIVLNGLGDVEGPMAQVAALGVDVRYHGADVSQPDEIAQLMTYVESEFGGTDILVNNAGVQHTASIEDFPVSEWDKIIAINLSAAFHTTRLALPGMREKNWGRIINIASVHGLVASVHKAAYVAAKHGLIGLTKTTALETAKTGITANAICPGWVLTPLVQTQIDARAASDGISFDEAASLMLKEKQPSGQFTTVEEIGAAAIYLASPATNNMRGIELVLDGGWTAQ